MRRLRTRTGAIVAGTAVVAAALPMVLTTVAAARATAQTPPNVTVQTGDNFFKPRSVTIPAGTKVVWKNTGRNVHDVKPNKGKKFGTARLKPGKKYSFRFTKPGKYPYYCSFHGSPGHGQYGKIVVTAPPPTTAASAPPPSAALRKSVFLVAGRTIEVPADAKTIQGAVDKARPGDLVLVDAGVYKEAVTVTTSRIVIRGVDRNKTILEGGFKLDNGVKVLDADGVAIENLTARNYTTNGFFWSGVDGYRGSYLTAYRNGDYGVYAFDSVNGQFDHSYASGSPDSGFYIGQCRPCNAVISQVTARYNELGYSGTNSSGNLFVVDSVWTDNRAGIVPNSLDSEELPPQGDGVFAGNFVARNQGTKAAVSGTPEFDAVFGVGIAIIGGVNNQVVKNRVVDQDRAGIVIAPNPGIQRNLWPSERNQVRDNVVAKSGTVDLGLLATTPAQANCFAGNTFVKSAPTDIEHAAPCDGVATADFTAGALDPTPYLDTSKNPKGTNYKKTPVPGKQPNMPKARTAKARPATSEPTIKVDLDRIKVPSSTSK